MRRALTAASTGATLLAALAAFGGQAYQCRVDGERHSRCCCEGAAGLADPSPTGDVERRCGCCTVVRFEPRELDPTVVSRVGDGHAPPAAALGLPHPAGRHLDPPSAPAIPQSAHAPPFATSAFLAHCSLRL